MRNQTFIITRACAFKSFKRYVATSGAQISHEILSSVTARGPFVDLPIFKCHGQVGEIIEVLLPQRSTIYLKGCEILSFKGGSLFASKAKLVGHLWVQELILPDSSTAFLTSSGLDSTSSFVTRVEAGVTWTIYKPESLTAWSGHGLSVLQRENALYLKGVGDFVTTCSTRTIQMKLKANESMSVSLRYLVASSARNVFTQTKDRMPSFAHLQKRYILDILNHLDVIRENVKRVMNDIFGSLELFSALRSRIRKRSKGQRLRTEGTATPLLDSHQILSGPGIVIVKTWSL